jgi:hypothetical protein
VDELGLTDEELAQVMRACAWVQATAGFLPYLREFVKVRLARRRLAILTDKIGALNARQTFRLWERLKEEQAVPSLLQNPEGARSLESSLK